MLAIWLVYLDKFVSRFGGAKLERARDLFEQALDGCPSDQAHKLYMLYAKLEEEHGLMRNAMSVYQRAVESVSIENRYELYNLYIAKAAEYFGVTKTRDIYESAINALPASLLSKMCLRYANLERKLGEIDRARAVYMHGAQEVDPSTDAAYWQAWHDFEVAHGNEDTFREMLRLKRSVKAQYTQASVTLPRPGEKRPREEGGEPADAMASLEAQAAPPPRPAIDPSVGFQPAPTFEGHRPGYVFKLGEVGLGYYRDGAQGGGEEGEGEAAEEQIDLDDEDEPELEQQAVPSAVFGAAGLESGMGALERFKRAKADA